MPLSFAKQNPIDQGSITHITQGENVLNEYEYDAWGEVTHSVEKVENRFKFNGQQLDPITGQYYLRARFYNPVIARFTQEDTYRGDGLNLYAYCRNNPVYYVDPTGNICATGAQKIQDKIDNGIGISNNERKKLESYNRIQEKKKAQSETSNKVAENQPDRPVIDTSEQRNSDIKKNQTQDQEEKGLFLPNEYYENMDMHLNNALMARDEEVARIQSLSKTKQSLITTVVAGVDLRTGQVAVGSKNSKTYKGNAICAEDIVFSELGGNEQSNIIITPAIRPRTGEVIPVCTRCQLKYPKNQFIKGAVFDD